MSHKWFPLIFVFIFFQTISFAYSLQTGGTPADIYHKLLKLKETKRVLYVAAHPDDENTRLISFLGNEEHAQVAYLSLTRGDGGQNLIGRELGLELGMIRTQELLQARQEDGGKQYFSRALDFGFSKHPDETFNNWDKEKLLGDVVWIIRMFQPDIIITRFNTEPGTTHGHHTSSAILAGKAFKDASDASAYQEQLQYVAPWEPKRIFWNAYSWGGEYEPEKGKQYHQFPVGKFNPLLGITYSQMAADSRTMHKSQGFGATAQIGRSEDYIQLVDGGRFQNGPFDDIASRWESVPNGKAIVQKLNALLSNFNFTEPVKNITPLLAIKKELDSIKSNELWVKEKQSLINEIIVNSLGLTAEFNAENELTFPGQLFKSQMVFNNPTAKSIKLIDFTVLDKKLPLETTAENNIPFRKDISITLPQEYPISQPYWLEEEVDDNMFQIEDIKYIGKPWNNPAVTGILSFELDNQLFRIELPIKYKYNDQIEGEVNQPFTITPEIVISTSKNNLFIIGDNPSTMEVEVGFFGDMVEGTLAFEGLEENQYKVLHSSIDAEKSKKTYTVQFTASENSQEKVEAKAKYVLADGREYDRDIKRIKYNHIPNITHFPQSRFNILNMDLKMSDQRIGYIPGAGDDVPEVLRELGYSVTILDGSLNLATLKNYSSIITGIRAFNVNETLANNTDQLMEFVKEGGNLIVQYNTSSPLLSSRLGPFDIKLSRDRVTVEDSPVQFDRSHRIFSHPNTIEQRDFDNWVQERGLYFPGEWDNRYETPLTLNEPGESSKEGALLFTKYEKGTYTYSGISWFRLLPAGVPGAIKIFVNLLEQTHGE